MKWKTPPLWAGSSNRLGSVALYGLQPLCEGAFVGKTKLSNVLANLATKSSTCSTTAPGVAMLASFSCPLACAVCIAESLRPFIDLCDLSSYKRTLLRFDKNLHLTSFLQCRLSSSQGKRKDWARGPQVLDFHGSGGQAPHKECSRLDLLDSRQSNAGDHRSLHLLVARFNW